MRSWKIPRTTNHYYYYSEKRLRQNSESCTEPSLRICSECTQLYKNLSRFFEKLCEDMGAEYSRLLYYNSTR